MATVAKDVVRWKGVSDSDVQPVRIYLGPWQPRPDCLGVALLSGSYAQPTPWAEPPTVYDSMILEGVITLGPPVITSMLYARIVFGAGGVVHNAYVDWPPRGLLLQVSAHYVQVDGVGNFTPAGGVNPTTLPLLQAHVAPEPGGGDAGNPGTFTYPVVNTGDVVPLVFQVPPFARAFTPLIPRGTLIAMGITQMNFVVFSMQNFPTDQEFVFPLALGADFPDTIAIPLSGSAASIRVTAIGAGPAPGTVWCGMMFHLDL
jgi:hypothetical protein